MNLTARKDSVTNGGPRQRQAGENILSPNLPASLSSVALLATADQPLAHRLTRELAAAVPKQAVSVAGSLSELRAILRTCSPSVIFLDSDLLGGIPLDDAVCLLASTSPVLVLASVNAQADIAKLVLDERVDFIARIGDFVPLAFALIARRMKRLEAKKWDTRLAPGQISPAMGEIFRHEINNPLTSILGNAELVLAHRERFSGVEVQRLQTVGTSRCA